MHYICYLEGLLQTTKITTKCTINRHKVTSVISHINAITVTLRGTNMLNDSMGHQNVSRKILAISSCNWSSDKLNFMIIYVDIFIIYVHIKLNTDIEDNFGLLDAHSDNSLFYMAHLVLGF